MITRPSSDDILEGVLVSIQNDIMPELTSQRAVVAATMAQAVLQMVRQRIPVEQQLLAAEHNEMLTLFQDLGVIVGESAGPEAQRIRERVQQAAARQPFPALPAYDELSDAYYALSQAIVETLDDLDGLIRAGNPVGEQALTRVRENLGPRTARDFATYVIGVGMAGRG